MPMPIGTEISVASAIISSVPRIALLMPPSTERSVPKVAPVGSVVNRAPLTTPRPFLRM